MMPKFFFFNFNRFAVGLDCNWSCFQVKCVYDARMFSNEPGVKTGAGERLFDSETEAEYFSKMNARNNTKTILNGVRCTF